jgi:hypothetical protein
MRTVIARARRTLAAVLFAAVLPGCALDFDSTLVDPAAYDYYSCEQLRGIFKGLELRQTELEGYLSRAAKDTAGNVIGAVTYGPDLRSTRGRMKVIERVAGRKECDPPVKPAPATSTG